MEVLPMDVRGVIADLLDDESRVDFQSLEKSHLPLKNGLQRYFDRRFSIGLLFTEGVPFVFFGDNTMKTVKSSINGEALEIKKRSMPWGHRGNPSIECTILAGTEIYDYIVQGYRLKGITQSMEDSQVYENLAAGDVIVPTIINGKGEDVHLTRDMTDYRVYGDLSSNLVFPESSETGEPNDDNPEPANQKPVIDRVWAGQTVLINYKGIRAYAVEDGIDQFGPYFLFTVFEGEFHTPGSYEAVPLNYRYDLKEEEIIEYVQPPHGSFSVEENGSNMLSRLQPLIPRIEPGEVLINGRVKKSYGYIDETSNFEVLLQLDAVVGDLTRPGENGRSFDIDYRDLIFNGTGRFFYLKGWEGLFPELVTFSMEEISWQWKDSTEYDYVPVWESSTYDVVDDTLLNRTGADTLEPSWKPYAVNDALVRRYRTLLDAIMQIRLLILSP